MHREERRIFFTNAELIQGLALFCDASHRIFNFDKQARLLFRTTPTVAVRVSDEQSDVEPIEFPEAEIAAALIMVSKAIGIPLAKRAEKTIELVEESIVFVLRLA